MTSNKRVWVKCVNMHRDKFDVSVDDVDDVDDLKKAIAVETMERKFPLSVSHIVNGDDFNIAYDVETRIVDISPYLYSRTVFFTADVPTQKTDITSLTLGTGQLHTSSSATGASNASVLSKLLASDLTVAVIDCKRPADKTLCCRHLVELEEMVERAMYHIGMYTHVKGGLQFRVPPVVHATLSRGGKTTFLTQLFDRLKLVGYAPILASLNNLISVIPGETDRQKLVRSIAAQFVDGKTKSQLPLTIDEDVLWEHIENTRAGKGVILLLDDLPLPLDGYASQMLKEQWLDKMGRYFVFTTHVPITTEFVLPKEACNTLQCIDLNKYRDAILVKPLQGSRTLLF